MLSVQEWREVSIVLSWELGLVDIDMNAWSRCFVNLQINLIFIWYSTCMWHGYRTQLGVEGGFDQKRNQKRLMILSRGVGGIIKIFRAWSAPNSRGKDFFYPPLDYLQAKNTPVGLPSSPKYLMQNGPWVPELWLDTQTDRQTEITTLNIYYIIKCIIALFYQRALFHYFFLLILSFK